MTARWVDHFGTGIHSARPAASAVPKGSLYACSTHGLIYQSDGSSTWSTWATLGSTGGGLTAVTEVTTPSTPGAGTQTLFLDSADHHLKRVDSSGTVTDLEAGGGGSAWTSALNNDLSSLTGFTGLAGTWAVSSGVARQSDTTASTVQRIRNNTKRTLPTNGIVEVEMRYNARSSGNTRMGLIHKFDGTGSGGCLTYLQTTDGTAWTSNTEVDAVSNLANFGSVTYTSGDWAKLRIVYTNGYWTVYLNGTLLDGVPVSTAAAVTNGYVGLYAYGCDASFRNLKVWTPTLPA